MAPNFNSIFLMSAAARAARLAKQKQKNELKAKQSMVLLQNKLATAKEELKSIKKIIEQSEEPQSFVGYSVNEVLQDLLDHSNGSTIDFTNATYEVAMQIKAVSPKAYSILEKQIGFPAQSQVEAKYKAAIADIPEKLTNIERVGDMVNLWKEKSGISKSVNIDACLAVDALYFKPDFKITENDCISGTGITEELKIGLPEGSFKHFDSNPSTLQAFLELNWEKIVKSGVVFQIQPYNVVYKPFVVHIRPSTNGKASEEIVDLLYRIKDTVKNRRITIKSFAFDGDNAYKQLHTMYFESYIHKVLKSNQINTSYTHSLRIVSDYLHLLKRLRYRLLSSIIHSGFNTDTDKILVDELQKVLDEMGEVVWRNEPYTKMHDKLPLELFKTENLLKLIESKQFTAAAYWFPITLSNIAINQKDIGFEYRDFLLKCSFYFLVYYYECWERADGDLRQRKNGENLDVTFYTKDLLIEFTNTLHAHIQLMHNVEKYNFNRNSSTPLEHKFAYGRAKSHNINTLTRFIHVISSLQGVETEKILKEVASFEEEADKIRGRFLRSGITVESKNEDSAVYAIDSEVEDDLPFSPQNVAKAFLLIAGFDVQVSDIVDYEDAFCWTEYFLTNFIDDEPEKRKIRKSITLNTFRYGVDNCQNSRKFITGKPGSAPLTTHQHRKYEFKTQLFQTMCEQRLGGPPNKENLLEILEIIKKADPNCPHPPKASQSKGEIYSWIIDNLQTYFVLLDQYP